MDRKRRPSFCPVSSPPSENETGAGIGVTIREHERFLPIANVSRIIKKSLPANAKISKEAKATVQECVSEFISFITSEASDKCQREKRKTINGEDLLWAMTTLGFENYVGPLKVYLDKYRETEGEKTSMARQGGDQSPEETNFNTTDHAANPTASRRGLSGFHGGAISTSLGMGGRVLGYGDKSEMDGFHVGKINENGDGNGLRSRASHQLGLKW